MLSVQQYRTVRAIALVLLLLFVASIYSATLASYSLGLERGRSEAVCHAPTEDSFPTDCDYRHGGWYRK